MAVKAVVLTLSCSRASCNSSTKISSRCFTTSCNDPRVVFSLDHYTIEQSLRVILGCFCFNVPEAVRKRRFSAFQLSENAFDGIPISVARDLKSASSSLEYGLEVLSTIRRLGCLLALDKLQIDPVSNPLARAISDIDPKKSSCPSLHA
jgi:hypothetical protein